MEESKEIVPLNQSLSVPQTTPVDIQEYGIALYENTLASILSGIDYSIPTEPLELAEEEKIDKPYALPALLEDRALALTLMNELILSAEAFNKIITEDLQGPICPYQRTLEEYLGKNYIVPSLYDIVLPSTFSFPAVKAKISEFQTKVHTKMREHLNIMVKEAIDTGFPGITSENIGNAFAVLQDGKYVIDKEKLAKHLEFDEMVKNVPLKNFIEMPYITSLLMLQRYSEIAD